VWNPASFGHRGPMMEVRVILDTAPAIEESEVMQCKLLFLFNTTRFKEIMHSGASDRWEPGEPNGDRNENCLALNVNSTNSLLRDENCGAKLRYICEAKLPLIVLD
jgi:hypothetical protein